MLRRTLGVFVQLPSTRCKCLYLRVLKPVQMTKYG